MIRRTAKGFCGGPIVEVEAYLADDPASHGFAGETPRTRVMYGPPGRAYVYFIYGAHFCVNAVCRPVGHAEAVLIRAIEPEVGIELMQENRPVAKAVSLTNGPGKLCAAMRIDRKLDGANLCDSQGELFVAINPNLKAFLKKRGSLITTTRIGITRAAHLSLRFYLGGSPFISKRAQAIAPPGSPNPARSGR